MKFFLSLVIFFSYIKPLQANALTLTKIRGNVYVNGEKVDRHFPLQAGDSIEIKDDKSYVVFKHQKFAHFMLEKGKLTLEKISPTESSFKLDLAHFSAKIEFPKSYRPILFHTANTHFKTMLAAFSIHAHNTYDYICVGEGSLDVSKISQEAEKRSVGAGEDFYIYYNQRKNHKQSASVKLYKTLLKSFVKMEVPIEDIRQGY